MPKKGNAYLAGTVHVAKEVQTIQRYQLEPYMSEKRVKPESATVHVAKCFPESSDGNKFCPKQIFVWFAKNEEFHTKHINYDFKDYSDASQRQWHTLVKKGHH